MSFTIFHSGLENIVPADPLLTANSSFLFLGTVGPRTRADGSQQFSLVRSSFTQHLGNCLVFSTNDYKLVAEYIKS